MQLAAGNSVTGGAAKSVEALKRPKFPLERKKRYGQVSPFTSTQPARKVSTPRYSTMHSGEPCLILEDGIDYDSFPGVAAAWACKLQLNVDNEADGPDVRLLVCEKDGKRYWLAYDDWFSELSLEPCDAEAAAEILRIGAAIGVVRPDVTA